MTQRDYKYIKKGKMIYEIFVSVNNPYNHKKNGKRGRDYLYSDELMLLGAILYQLLRSLRVLQGFIEGLLIHKGFNRSPYFTTLFRRIFKSKLLERVKNLIEINKDKENKINTIVIDSTGFSINYDSIYRVTKYHNRKKFVKLVIAIDENNRIIDWRISDERLSEAGVAKEIIKRYNPKNFYGDGAYDDIDLLYYCQNRNINAVVKIRRNARPKGFKQRLRNKLYKLQREDPRWKEKTNYNFRTSVERLFSSIKRTMHDYLNSKKYHNNHLEWKILTYLFLNNELSFIDLMKLK